MSLGPTFEPVLEGARLGQSWAWELLYEDLAGPLLGYLRGQGIGDPEDAMGEVWLQVARGMATFSGDERALRSWMFTIAHHRMVDSHRRAARRPTVPLGPDAPQTAPLGDGPELQVLEAIATTETRALLSVLTPDQREVVLLRIFGELTTAEIARLTARPEGSVKSLQHRALAALRRSLAGPPLGPVSTGPLATVARRR